MGWIFETATFPLIGRAHTHREERERDGDDVEAGRDLGPRGRLRGARAHQERCRDQVQPHPRCASRLARSPFFLPSLPPPPTTTSLSSSRGRQREGKAADNTVSLPRARPGTGRTGYMPIPPNNYPFYKDEEKYEPVVQPDGGQLSGKSRLPNRTAPHRRRRRKLTRPLRRHRVRPRRRTQTGSPSTSPPRRRRRRTESELTRPAFPTGTSPGETSTRACRR